MAQIRAVTPSCSSTDLIFNGSKRVPFLRPDRVCGSIKLSSFQELGVKGSELHRHVIVHKDRNLTKAHNHQAIKAALTDEKETGASSAGDERVLRKKLNKVVLAYSGGLDTSVIVPWLRENYGCEAMVDVAREVGADAVSHGCTGKGNDQVRI
ncbi:hypothetical protein C3L33_22681, partial [Rhododendron williamsianum]